MGKIAHTRITKQKIGSSQNQFNRRRKENFHSAIKPTVLLNNL